MNAYQKATLLLSFTTLPLVLLFMDSMNYRGVGFAAFAGLAGVSGLIFALRSPANHQPMLQEAPSDLRRASAPPAKGGWRIEGEKIR